MADITDAELADLRAAADERDQLAAHVRDLQAGAVPVPPDAEAAAAEDVPPEPDHVALMPDGSRYEYAGAHPTHIAVGDKEVRVLSVHPL